MRRSAPSAAGTGGEADPAGGEALRAAVRERARAVLISTGCQGRCPLGPVATVGHAHPSTGPAVPGTLTWTSPPVVLGPLDPPGDRALAAWIRRTAPRLADLPPRLRALLPG
ncbi:hypothetical protein JL107_16160 [Nakamurella flavida]|uniref:Uncharacterized protein n=1 Tax=Nakamurella flavida TaxID=363630 RepID=A0A938YMI6_9ACTN|nr:hypothetical protein [Nakamurella flavida]MBM9477984.1 hypothetical protein [Nakamurella flavida]MDP9778300.1 hypothetical protein [Nakamurella flavida]